MSEVPPTRMNLGVFKGKHIAAKKGYDLLKSKADALKVRFRDICKVIYDTKTGMSEQASESFFSLTQAEYAAGKMILIFINIYLRTYVFSKLNPYLYNIN